MGPDGIERVRAAGPYGAALARETDAWTGFTAEGRSVPHDPITALAMLRPELYETETRYGHLDRVAVEIVARHGSRPPNGYPGPGARLPEA
ncbi:hypothetical protein [Streptomyces sp. NPDC020571]|uniref:hypothetical protein n=1 Tax=Streptomyces sp. NPDC020571 TaxID=3365079 RepID=UPI0037AA6B04